MKNFLILATLLFALPTFCAVTVPPIVIIPPHYHEFGWREWNAYEYTMDEVAPDNETKGSFMSRNPQVTFEVLHDADEEACTDGPVDSWEYPNVQRCAGVI